MNKLIPIARFLFAFSLAIFGIQHFFYGHFGLTPFPSWLPFQTILAYISGLLTVAVAFCIMAQKMDRQASLLLGLVYLLNTVLLHVPRVIGDLHNGNEWTGCFEMLALSCGCLLLAGPLHTAGRSSHRSADGMDPIADAYTGAPNSSLDPLTGWLVRATPFFFSACLLVYAGLHFVYADYIATLIPSWIPARLFLSYFIGVAFLLSAVAIAIKKYGRLAATLIGIMFYIWFLILHAPRVVANPHTEAEWTSAFVALAIGSLCLILAVVLPE